MKRTVGVASQNNLIFPRHNIGAIKIEARASVKRIYVLLFDLIYFTVYIHTHTHTKHPRRLFFTLPRYHQTFFHKGNKQ